MADEPMPDAAAVGDGTDELNEGNQIRISFVLDPSVTTKETPEGDTLEVPSDPIAVPSNVRRRGLSAIINHLLDRKVEKESGDDSDESEEEDSDDEDRLPSLPFDFLVNGRYLRTGIEAAARREGLSLETAVKVHYFPAAKAPTGRGESEEMPDWITAMSSCSAAEGSASGGVNGDKLFTGCADGAVRAFSCSNDGVSELGTVTAHSGPVKCIASLPPTSDDCPILVASGSVDQTLLIHAVDDSEKKLALHSVFSGGHSSSICSVALLRKSDDDVVMTSGDWNGGLSVWKVPKGGASSSSSSSSVKASKKKQKTSSSTSTDIEVEEVQPIISVNAHASNISGIAYTHGSNGRNVITGSWDNSLKVYDMERQDCILTLNGSRVVTALGRCHNSDVVASAHPDCTVRLWDMRVNIKNGAGSNSVSDTTLKPSHKAWVSDVQWSPIDPYVLATTSHDGTVKVWDIRSSLPLHTVRAHPKGGKGLCIAYSNGVIYSGGTDCVVKRFVC
mmetsp:Transcript_23063/g.50061  ORF Transcript_23063/g.50061 Transcript_23063/m.50061 type:complete len:504 (-) Transcript_23063:48-1559(-)|eukprot:CAMPEP_0178507504 /NCGR_PEP_ID=MMETSP0696-20121128/20252_1 /TAXON_ID=265572 /ORGANISM="Extubocellulus spinifer, Strain CCMP396" /LENGTH=503 /DNA_ID=CAMNT_0020136991 /DNA_START=37 /DNA_END=1551 /DNA_ORIENTATION=+